MAFGKAYEISTETRFWFLCSIGKDKGARRILTDGRNALAFESEAACQGYLDRLQSRYSKNDCSFKPEEHAFENLQEKFAKDWEKVVLHIAGSSIDVPPSTLPPIRPKGDFPVTPEEEKGFRKMLAVSTTDPAQDPARQISRKFLKPIPSDKTCYGQALPVSPILRPGTYFIVIRKNGAKRKIFGSGRGDLIAFTSLAKAKNFIARCKEMDMAANADRYVAKRASLPRILNGNFGTWKRLIVDPKLVSAAIGKNKKLCCKMKVEEGSDILQLSELASGGSGGYTVYERFRYRGQVSSNFTA